MLTFCRAHVQDPDVRIDGGATETCELVPVSQFPNAAYMTVGIRLRPTAVLLLAPSIRSSWCELSPRQ